MTRTLHPPVSGHESGTRIMLSPTMPAPGHRSVSRWTGGRGRWLGVLALCLVALLVGGVTATAWADSGTRTAPPSTDPGPPPLPLPTVDPTPCGTGSVPAPGCPPVTPAAATSLPPSTPTPGPCTGPDCIPQPITTPPAAGGGSPGGGPSGGGQADCSFLDTDTWDGCLTNAIAGFLAGLVASSLSPLLDLLGNTLLTTPDPGSVPQIGVLWTNSWQLMLACYGILVLIAGIVVMAYQTLHTHYGIKEIAPRIGAGFLAGTLSLFLATKAIQLANALAQGILGDGVDTATAANSLKTMLEGTQNGGIFLVLFGIVLAGLVLALLVVYAIRLVITVMLLAVAPLALMLHALPQTEGIARWWWRAFGAVLAIQLGQSLALVTAMRVFFSPDGVALFGNHGSGNQLMVSMLVTAALFYLLFRIPFWLLSATKISHGRSLTGTLLRAYVLGRAFGLLRGRTGRGGRGRPRFTGGGGRGPRPGGGGSGGGGGPRPRPTRPSGGPTGSSPGGGTSGSPSRTSGGGRRTSGRSHPGSGSGGPRPGPPPTGHNGPGNQHGARASSAARGNQPPSSNPYRGTRPDRSAQYPLPVPGVHRTPRPPHGVPSRPSTRPAPPPATRSGQVQRPFDPYRAARPNRSGQYQLPLDGATRVPVTRPTTGPTTPARSAAHPSPAPRLPLNRPPARSRLTAHPTPAPTAGATPPAQPAPPAA